MTVVVFGASGQIGHFLLPRLRGRGEQVIAVSREPHADSEGVRWMRGGLPDAVPALPPVSAVVSYGPLQPFARWLQPGGGGELSRASGMSLRSFVAKLLRHTSLLPSGPGS